jgi:hypothetical protein
LMEAKLSRALNIAESVARVDMLQSRGHVARGAWGARFYNQSTRYWTGVPSRTGQSLQYTDGRNEREKHAGH